MKRLMLLIVGMFFVVFAVNVSAVCTVTLDKSLYAKTETMTATMSCDGGNEKSKAYVLNWTNRTTSGAGIELEIDTGTTPSTASQAFVETFVIPSDFVGDYINVTLTGTNLEGDDNATISAASASSLVLANINAKGKFLGLSSSIDLDVLDENGKEITGGNCAVAIIDPTNDEVLFEDDNTPISNKKLHVSTILNYERFIESKDYVWEVGCFCGAAAGNNQCIDEDGSDVTNSKGTTSVAFTTSSWFTFLEDPLPLVNTSNDKDLRNVTAGFDHVHWKVNITNNNPTSESLFFILTTLLINNETGQVTGDPIKIERTTQFRNGTAIFEHLIPPETETGKYIIRNVFDVFYKG